MEVTTTVARVAADVTGIDTFYDDQGVINGPTLEVMGFDSRYQNGALVSPCSMNGTTPCHSSLSSASTACDSRTTMALPK